MNCPKCSGEMVEGQTHMGGQLTTLLMGGGLSFGNLTFKAAEWSGHVMVEGSDVWPAHYRDNCGVITIETSRRGLSTLED